MLKTVWRQFLADRVSRAVQHRIAPELRATTERALSDLRQDIAELRSDHLRLSAELEGEQLRLAQRREEDRIGRLENQPYFAKPWLHNLHTPPIGLHPKLDGDFMTFSTCSTRDFLHRDYEKYSKLLGLDPQYHRKYWEWVFILHQAMRTGSIAPGKRALGFAVGSEPLPSAFAAAGSTVVATDAPEDLGVGSGWKAGGEYASQAADLYKPELLEQKEFERLVSYMPCDMKAIPENLTGFDFCWSACSFEHLGSLAAGLDFVQESVEKTLKPGGVAVHTTEFNWSSDTETVFDGPTVLYRRSDLSAFLDRMERRGHQVEPLQLAPDTHVLDFFVDTPPYSMPVHLKLRLMDFVSTSVGLIIRRGP